jgi:hypothetical protein
VGGLSGGTCIGSCGVDQNQGNGYASPNNGWVRQISGWNDIDQTVSVQPNTNYTLTGAAARTSGQVPGRRGRTTSLVRA